MKELICIVCPKGCHLKVKEGPEIQISGAGCEKGVAYGREEMTNPVRMATSTVRIRGGAARRLPVKTSTAIPKQLVRQAVALLAGVEVVAPVRTGDVVLKNVLGTGADFVATRDM